MTALLRRALLAFGTVLLVLTVTFAGLHLAPGDPVRLYLGPSADEAAAEAMRRELGLDRPLVVQYGDWLRRFALGDWGTSIAQRRAVTRVLADAVGPTMALTGISLILTYLVGIVLGVIQASRVRTFTDTFLTIVTVTAQAIPSYVLGLGLVLLFTYGAALWGDRKSVV